MSSNSSSSESVSPSQNRSFPFTISAILSDEVGHKKSPPASCLNAPFPTPVSNINSSKVPVCTSSQTSLRSSVTPKRPRKSSSSYISARTPKITCSEAGLMVTPGCQTFTNKPCESLRGGQHTATYYTPYKPLASSQVNASHISPFNTNVLLALGQHPSPNRDEREELFGETSLGMLSEVAQYHGEMSGVDPNSTTETTMHEKFANIRLLSVNDDVEPSSGDARNTSLNVRGRKILTPSILKRDKKRRRVSSGENVGQNTSGDDSMSSSKYSQFHHNTGFLSPLANEKSSLNKELGFSPSIFLSRPDDSHSMQPPTCSPPSSALIPIPRPDSGSSNVVNFDHRESSKHLEHHPESDRPGFDSDFCAHESAIPDQIKSSQNGERFVTSTPIKNDKENLRKRSAEQEEGGWSPTILHSSGRKHLQECNDASSGKEFEAFKRQCLPTPTQKHQRKSKARTKLSPLLENSYSPIFKDTSHLPSPLTTALATTPMMGVPFNVISQASTSPLVPLPQPVHSTSHTSFSQSSLPPVMLPPHHAPLLGPRVLASTAVSGTGSLVRAQPLLGGSTSTTIPHPSLPYNFPAGLLKQQQLQQVSTPHALQTQLLRPLSIPQLHPTSLPFNPLVPGCNTQPLQGYNNNNVICNAVPPPGYLPLVSLVTTPTTLVPTPTTLMPTPSYLYAPYTNNTQMMPLERSVEGKTTLQSVPPWFIFSNNRSEKRSRLTEAINKSLSETPSQPSKLPMEWTKLAYGQTKDQKTLTERARMFLHFCPRQLTFNDDAD